MEFSKDTTEEDIELVMLQAGCDRDTAAGTLKKTHNDLIRTIFLITNGKNALRD